MLLDIMVPSAYIGAVIKQIAGSRGQVLATEYSDDIQVIRALVPFSEILGYATDLRSATQGHGAYTMEFHHYQTVPPLLQNELIR